MMKAHRTAERVANEETARLRARDALRALLERLRPILDARNEEMSGGGHGPDKMHGYLLLAPGEYDPETALPLAVEIRTPSRLAFRLGIAQHDAVLRLEWLLTAEFRPLPCRVIDAIDCMPDGDAMLSYRGRNVRRFNELLDRFEERIPG